MTKLGFFGDFGTGRGSRRSLNYKSLQLQCLQLINLWHS